MKLLINGESRDCRDGASIAAVIEELGLPAKAVLVEHNGVALRRDEWNSAALAAGDRLEIIRIVAGG